MKIEEMIEEFEMELLPKGKTKGSGYVKRVLKYIASAAKQQRTEEILELLKEANNLYYKNIYPPHSRWKEGWDDCVENVKQILTKQENE